MDIFQIHSVHSDQSVCICGASDTHLAANREWIQIRLQSNPCTDPEGWGLKGVESPPPPPEKSPKYRVF